MSGAAALLGAPKLVSFFQIASPLPQTNFSRILKATNSKRHSTMTIHLTPEQERRVRAVISGGTYESLEEVVDAALATVEQRTLPCFAGTQEELEALLTEGLVSKELTEDEFWSSVDAQTEPMVSEHKTGPAFGKFLTGKPPATILYASTAITSFH